MTKEAILESRLNNAICVCSLFLFYVGIGLTLAYSFRLVALFTGPRNQASVISCSFRTSTLFKVPSFLLLMLSVCQGSSFSLAFLASPNMLGLEDKFVIFGVLLLSMLLSFKMGNFIVPSYSPFL